ncbi:hypothetical protein [Mesorhizobium sp. M4B.F.Ca.ET.049.02.1.2]|nr:hypothetical protein [Mesorhizobium sp. M4B.F.Ca.ET.049.02.1.2]
MPRVLSRDKRRPGIRFRRQTEHCSLLGNLGQLYQMPDEAIGHNGFHKTPNARKFAWDNGPVIPGDEYERDTVRLQFGRDGESRGSTQLYVNRGAFDVLAGDFPRCIFRIGHRANYPAASFGDRLFEFDRDQILVLDDKDSATLQWRCPLELT